MDMTKLECFLSVVKNQNYSLAAEEISMSQSSVSKHILQMEKELGVQLLERNTQHTRKVTMTEAGREIYDDAENIWSIYQGMLKKLEQYSGMQTLKIGSVDHLQKVGAMAPIVAFMREHPEIHIDFEEKDTKTLLGMLLSKEIDIAIIAHIYYLDEGNLKDFPMENYLKHVLVRDHYYLAVNKNHRLVGAKCVDWDDLNGEKLIILDNSFSSNRIIREMMSIHHCQANIAFETNGLDSIWGMLLENYGVALLSKKVIQQMKGVVAVRMRDPIHRDTVLLGPREGSSAEKCFLDFLISNLSENNEN